MISLIPRFPLFVRREPGNETSDQYKDVTKYEIIFNFYLGLPHTYTTTSTTPHIHTYTCTHTRAHTHTNRIITVSNNWIATKQQDLRRFIAYSEIFLMLIVLWNTLS